MHAYLHVTIPNYAGAGSDALRISLTEGRWLIGRSPDCTIMLKHPDISDHQAELLIDPQRILLTVLSRHGNIIFQSKRLIAHTPILIEHYTRIQVGPYVLELRPEPNATHGTQPANRLLDPVQLLRTESSGQLAVERAVQTSIPELPVGSSRYLAELPTIYHDADSAFFSRYLQIFEASWEPLEHRHDHIAMYFRPSTCPESMLEWLGHWIGLDSDLRLSVGQRRLLLAEAAQLYRWRGTEYGLIHMLEICVQQTPSLQMHPTEPNTLIISMPNQSQNLMETALVYDLVHSARPAHLAFRIEWPATSESV